VAYYFFAADVTVLGFDCGNAWDLDFGERVYRAQVPGEFGGLCGNEVLGNADNALVAVAIAVVAGLLAIGSGVVAARR